MYRYGGGDALHRPGPAPVRRLPQALQEDRQLALAPTLALHTQDKEEAGELVPYFKCMRPNGRGT